MNDTDILTNILPTEDSQKFISASILDNDNIKYIFNKIKDYNNMNTWPRMDIFLSHWIKFLLLVNKESSILDLKNFFWDKNFRKEIINSAETNEEERNKWLTQPEIVFNTVRNLFIWPKITLPKDVIYVTINGKKFIKSAVKSKSKSKLK